MFGVMGISAAFAQAACAKKGEELGNHLKFRGSTADPIIYQISCTGEISVESTKNGEPVVQTYTDLNNTQVSIQADANTDIYIKGSVIKFVNLFYGPNIGYMDFTDFNTTKCETLEHLELWLCTGLTSLDLSANTALTQLSCSGCNGLTSLDLPANTALTQLSCNGCTGLTSLDLSANTALTQLNCAYCTGLTSLDLSANTELSGLGCTDCTGLTSLDLSANTALTNLDCTGCAGLTSLDLSANTALTNLDCTDCTGLTEIKYPATNSDVSTAVAGAITAATAADGTVYTDSAAAYYSTIETAATAKGWTISQL